VIVYVAGPYSAATPNGRLFNTERAMDVALALIQKGHIVFCPHLSHFLDTRAQAMGIAIPYEEWMRQDEAWLRKCDAFFLIESSPGVIQEYNIAINEMQIPIYYHLEDVPDAI